MILEYLPILVTFFFFYFYYYYFYIIILCHLRSDSGFGVGIFMYFECYCDIYAELNIVLNDSDHVILSFNQRCARELSLAREPRSCMMVVYCQITLY